MISAVLADGFVVKPAPRLDPGDRPAEKLAETTGHVSSAAIHTRDGGRSAGTTPSSSFSSTGTGPTRFLRRAARWWP